MGLLFNFDRIEKLTSLIKQYQNDREILFELYIERAISYIYVGDKLSSLDDLNMALKIDDKNWEIYYTFGIFYLEFNEPRKAIENFQKSLSLNPKAYINYFGMANIYVSIEEYDNAINCYTNVLRKNTRHYPSYQQRAYCYAKKTFYNEAIKDIERAIKIKPKNPYLKFHKAEILLKMGKSYEAIEEYKKSIELSHDEIADSHYGIAIAYAYLSDFENSIKEIYIAEELIENSDGLVIPVNPYSYYETLKGAIYTAFNYRAKAYICFLNAQQNYKDINFNDFENVKSYILFCILNLLYLERFDEAEKLFYRCIELKYTPSIWFIYKAALLWMRDKDLNSTLKLIEEGLKKGYRFDYSIKTNLFDGYLFREIKTKDQFKKLLTKYHNQIL
jgi:tetratricopeptide (TPR) repeat protein